MTEREKEYNEFMLKLADKANELRKDFNNLSLENQVRVKKDISNMALGEFLNYAKNNFQQWNRDSSNHNCSVEK